MGRAGAGAGGSVLGRVVGDVTDGDGRGRGSREGRRRRREGGGAGSATLPQSAFAGGNMDSSSLNLRLSHASGNGMMIDTAGMVGGDHGAGRERD